jgi:hypothetical protein
MEAALNVASAADVLRRMSWPGFFAGLLLNAF